MRSQILSARWFLAAALGFSTLVLRVTPQGEPSALVGRLRSPQAYAARPASRASPRGEGSSSLVPGAEEDPFPPHLSGGCFDDLSAPCHVSWQDISSELLYGLGEGASEVTLPAPLLRAVGPACADMNNSDVVELQTNETGRCGSTSQRHDPSQ